MMFPIEPRIPFSSLVNLQYLQIVLGISVRHHIIPISTVQPYLDRLVEENLGILFHGALFGDGVAKVSARGPCFAYLVDMVVVLIGIPVGDCAEIVRALGDLF